MVRCGQPPSVSHVSLFDRLKSAEEAAGVTVHGPVDAASRRVISVIVVLDRRRESGETPLLRWPAREQLRGWLTSSLAFPCSSTDAVGLPAIAGQRLALCIPCSAARFNPFSCATAADFR